MLSILSSSTSTTTSTTTTTITTQQQHNNNNNNNSQISRNIVNNINTTSMSSSIAATSSTPTVSSLRRRRSGRLFFSHLFQYFALVYEYICSIFHMRQKRIEPATTTSSTKQQQRSSPPSSSSSSTSSATLSDITAATASLSSSTTTSSCLVEDKSRTITPASIATKKLAALQYYKGKTLVLDLDETLVHSVRLGSYAARQQTVSTSIKRKKIEVQDDKQSMLYEVYKRPHVDFFLKTISQWYKVVIFTASMAEYADPVIDWLDQDHNVISQRYFRQSCIVRNGNFVKDISLAEPDLAKVCLVDNSNAAFGLFQENGIPLPGWISNPHDECLLDLLPLLDALRFTADVRSVLRLRLMGVS